MKLIQIKMSKARDRNTSKKSPKSPNGKNKPQSPSSSSSREGDDSMSRHMVQEIEMDYGDNNVEEETRATTKVPKIAEFQETLHCIDVLTFHSSNDGSDIGCLLMTTRTSAKMKIYCVKLDTLTRNMISPFHEHHVSLRKDTVNTTDSPCMKNLVGECIYNVSEWLNTYSRIGSAPIRYGSSLSIKISGILRETFFYLTVVSNMKKTTPDYLIDHSQNDEREGANGEEDMIYDDDDGHYRDHDNDDDDDNNGVIDDLSLSTEQRRLLQPLSDEERAVKEKSRSVIIALLLSTEESLNNLGPREDANNPDLVVTRILVRWSDDLIAMRQLNGWLVHYAVMTDLKDSSKQKKTTAGGKGVHAHFWTLLDKNKSRSKDLMDKFYVLVKGHDRNEMFTMKSLNQALYKWTIFNDVRIFFNSHVATMPDVFYIRKNVDQYKKQGFDITCNKASEISDIANLMRYVEGIFARKLPTSAVFAVAGGSNVIVPYEHQQKQQQIPVMDTKYYEFKKLMKVIVKGNFQDIVAIYQKKYFVNDITLCGNIKSAIVENIIVPIIIGGMDNLARHSYTASRCTVHAIKLKQIMEIYAELTGLPINDYDTEKPLKSIIATIRECQVVNFQREVPNYFNGEKEMYLDNSVHRHRLRFEWLDMCQVMEILYSPDISSVTSRTPSKYPWNPVVDSVRELQLSSPICEIKPSKMVLFLIHLDTNAVQYEEINHRIMASLFDNGDGPSSYHERVHIFDDIVDLCEKTKITTEATQQKFNIVNTTVVDILDLRDAQLIQAIITEQIFNVVVIIPGENGYIRAMLARYFTLKDDFKFHEKHCVTLDQLETSGGSKTINAVGKQYIVVPYLHLWSLREFSQFTEWLAKQDQVNIKRVFFTGSIDILSSLPGQAFIDLLRLVDFERVNQRVWHFQRPVMDFSTIIDQHWRLLEFGEKTPELAHRFMQSFNRMTITVCHHLKDLWYAKDFPTMAHLVANLINRINSRGGGATSDYPYDPFKNLSITVFNRNHKNNKHISILKECMRYETKSSAANNSTSILTSYKELANSVDTLQSDIFLSGYALCEDEVKHSSRHLFVITREDVLSLSRNELHVLFSMCNNIFVIDNPRTSYVIPTLARPITKTHWLCEPSLFKGRVKDQFISLIKVPTCRYTRETYSHEARSCQNNRDIEEDNDIGPLMLFNTKRKAPDDDNNDRVSKKTKTRFSLTQDQNAKK